MLWLVAAAHAAPFAEEICVEALGEDAGLAPIVDARPLFEPRDLDAYRTARMFLDVERMPPPTLMRPEAFVAYFQADLDAPAEGEPIAVQLDLVQHPLYDDHRLLRVGVQGRAVPPFVGDSAQVTVLVDVSPSMQSVFSRRYPVLPGGPGPDGLFPPVTRLDLVRHGLRGLTDQALTHREGQLALATYAGDATILLEPTAIEDTAAITGAIDRLAAGARSTRSGLEDATSLARDMYVPCSDNRLLVITDYNARLHRDLKQTLAQVAALGSGLEVSAVGLGMGERAAAQLEQLAELGLGNTWYADTAYELELAFAQEFGSSATVARDVALALEPGEGVAGHRVIGWREASWSELGNLPSGYQRSVFFDLRVSGDASPAVAWTAGSAIPGRSTHPGRVEAGPAVTWDDAPADLRLGYTAAMFATWLSGGLHEPWTLPQLEAMAEAAARPGHPEDAELVALVREARRIDEATLDLHHRR